MSFWDHIKQTTPPPAVTQVERSDDRRVLTFRWSDGAVTSATGMKLRGMCPCAACVDEWTHVRTIDPAKVPAETAVNDLSAVGNYALSLTFSDGHSTGIFNWTHLRECSSPGGT